MLPLFSELESCHYGRKQRTLGAPRRSAIFLSQISHFYNHKLGIAVTQQAFFPPYLWQTKRQHKMRSGPISTHSFLSLDVVRVRSTDSTEPVGSGQKETGTTHQPSPQAKKLTPDRQQYSWRTKDQSSIFRPAPPSRTETPDTLLIKRCLAFDDDDEE